MSNYFRFNKIVTHIVKHIDNNVCFLPEQFDNCFFAPKYDKSSVMLVDMYNKPYSATIISCITKWMTGFRFYPTSDTEHYQLVILHYFVVN